MVRNQGRLGMELPNRDIDIGTLRNIFRKYPGIDAVYLFGSLAIKKANRLSDIDLAIVPKDQTIKQKKLDIFTDLARAGYGKVDLVFMDTDDIVLKYEAVKNNNLIYQSPNFDRGEYFSRIIRDYFDFLPYLTEQRLALKQRARENLVI